MLFLIKLQQNLSLFWQNLFFHIWTLEATLIEYLQYLINLYFRYPSYGRKYWTNWFKKTASKLLRKKLLPYFSFVLRWLLDCFNISTQRCWIFVALAVFYLYASAQRKKEFSPFLKTVTGKNWHWAKEEKRTKS